MKRQVVRESKASESPSQKIHRPHKPQKVEPIKPEFKKAGMKQEISNTSIEDRPNTGLGYDGVFTKPAIKDRRIVSTVSKNNVSNLPRNDWKRIERFDIAEKHSLSSFNSGLDALSATNYSTTSAGSPEVGSTLAKVGFQSPRGIGYKLMYSNNQRKVTSISSSQSVDYPDKEPQIFEEESAMEFQAFRRESMKDTPVSVTSDDDMKHTDLGGLSYQVIESDDDSDEHKSMKARVVRRQGGVSPAQSKESVISQKSNDSQRMKNCTSDCKVTPDQRRTPVFSKQSSDGEKKVSSFYKVIAQLKERQKTFVQSHSEVNDLYLEMQNDIEVKPSDSFVLIGTKKDGDFVLASRLAKSLDNLKRFADACELDSKSSVSKELLDLREKFFIDFNKELKRYIDYPASVFRNARDRYQNMISWLKYAADHELSLNGAEFTKRFEEYWADIEEFRKECENLSTELREFGSYCLMLVTSLLKKVEELKHDDKALKLKIKNVTREKIKVHKLAVKMYQKNEELRTEQLTIDQKLDQKHDAAKDQECTITQLQKELTHLESGYGAVDTASSKMREEVSNLSKKIIGKETETRKKLLNHDKIMNDSEMKIATLEERNAKLHESLANKLSLSKSRKYELMRFIAGLHGNINKLNSEIDKVEKSRSDLEKEVEECTGYIVKAESAMATVIYKTDPKFCQPYPLIGHTPTEREMREWAELQRTKCELRRVKREVKLRLQKEAVERETRGDLEQEKDKIRQKLIEKDEAAEESRKLKKELRKKIEGQREEMRKLHLKVEGMQDGPQLVAVLSERYDMRKSINELTSAHRELLKHVELTEAAISAKRFEVSQRDHLMIEECRATEARDKLVMLVNERRQSQGDGSEVVKIVDTESRFTAYHQMIMDMATRRSEMKLRIAESEENDKFTREMEQRLHNKVQESIRLEQIVADLEFKLREQEMDRMN